MNIPDVSTAWNILEIIKSKITDLQIFKNIFIEKEIEFKKMVVDTPVCILAITTDRHEYDACMSENITPANSTYTIGCLLGIRSMNMEKGSKFINGIRQKIKDNLIGVHNANFHFANNINFIISISGGDIMREDLDQGYLISSGLNFDCNIREIFRS